MIRIAWNRLWNRKLNSIMMIFAMFFMFSFLPLGIHFAHESTVTLDETIEQYGRGSYDVLIRPKGSRTDIEKSMGVVEENYIGDGSGGISLEDWDELKNRADIEVAAPVASIGYFSGNRTSIELPLLDYPARVTWQFYTSDGLKQYPLTNKEDFTYFEGEPLNYRELITSSTNMTGFMGIKMPMNYYLLTGIDPESEGKLTGVDFSTIYRQFENNSIEHIIVEDLLKLKGDAELIPVLKRNDLQIPLYLELKVDRLNLTHPLAEYKEMYGVPVDEPIFMIDPSKRPELEIQLKQEPITDSETVLIDLSTYQSPFDGTFVQITEDYLVEKGTNGDGSLFNDTALYFTASKIPYQFDENQINVKKVKDGEPPLYKHVHQKGESYLENPDLQAPFMLWQMGTFTSDSNYVTLTSSPLGIYSTEEVYTEDGTKIKPTTVPGSFIATPAAGVTTLEAAQLIKGDKPIDAIRIRVAGIDSYTKEAQDKIERVATDLFLQGYEVDIVAGSSFRKLNMNVEGYGQVTSPWTTLGVAQSLQQGWNKITLVTTVLFTLFGFIWFSSRLIYERNTLFSENEILYKLGWAKGNIYLRNCTEQFIVITFAFLFSFFIPLLMGVRLSPLLYLFELLLYLFATIVVLVMFRKDKTKRNRVQAYKRLSSVSHYWPLIFPTGIVLVVSSVVMITQLVNITETLSKSNETTLGAFAAEATLLFQVGILLASLGLTIISISDAIHSILLERKDEFRMYFVIGWNLKTIRKHFSKEVMQWGGASLLFGGIISLAIMLSTRMPLITFLYSFLSINMIIFILFAIFIRRNISF
jgi:putative ABC transport system permease protein